MDLVLDYRFQKPSYIKVIMNKSGNTKQPSFFLRLRRSLIRRINRAKLKLTNPETIFTDIYKKNAWGGKESISGRGSDANQTQVLIQELPDFLKKFKISKLLDIPCGDFAWMEKVNLWTARLQFIIAT